MILPKVEGRRRKSGSFLLRERAFDGVAGTPALAVSSAASRGVLRMDDARSDETAPVG